MKNADFDHFSAKWIAVHEIYNKTTSDAATTLAFKVLEKFEWEDVSRALDAHLLDAEAGRFPPKPADLAKYLTGDPESKPLAAWTAVEETIRRQGPYRTVIFDDRLTMAVVSDLGGWIQLCNITDDELPFKRNEFVIRYRGYMKMPPHVWPRQLQGLSPSDAPILIGNQKKAEQVYLEGAASSKIPMRAVTDILGGLTLPRPQ